MARGSALRAAAVRSHARRPTAKQKRGARIAKRVQRAREKLVRGMRGLIVPGMAPRELIADGYAARVITPEERDLLLAVEDGNG